MADSNSINTPLARNQNITPLEIDFREPPSSISYNLEAFHDPHDFHNKDAAKSTSLQASFTLFCSFVGVSLLSIPYSFKLAGLGLSIISMIIIAYLTWYCLSLVLIVAEAQPSNERMTLEILSHKLLGNWAVYVVQISVSLLQIGICTVILMFSSSFLDYVVCNFGIVSLCGNIPFRAVVVLMVTIPLTMINNMHWFYISSLFSSIFIFIGVITQFSFNINVLEQQPLSTDYILSKLNEFKFYNLPVFFGVAIYTFEGIGTLFSVRYAMQTPRDFPGILRNQMIMIAFLYILFPAMCYIAFGSNVPEVVTFTLPINNTLYLWVQGLLVVAALCGYSLQLFPTLKILENSSMFRHRIFDDKGRTKNPFLRYGLRIMIIFLMIIVVFSGVSFNLWISFIGAFVSTFIGFILPVLLYERQFRSNVSKKTKILNKISLYAGGIMGVLGVTQTLGIMIGIFPKAE